MANSSKTEFALFRNSADQTRFIKRVLLKLKLNQSGLAKLLKNHPRNVSGWVNGKQRIPYKIVCKCTELSGVSVPAGVRLLLWGEHLCTIGKKGGRSLADMRVADPTREVHRKSAWKQWWNNEGRFSPRKSRIMQIHKPKLCPDLAEFVGILMGDGTIAPYHISITLNSDADADYIPVVHSLIKKLFRVEAKMYPRKDSRATAVVIQRKGLSDFAYELGVPRGNKLKQGLTMPGWIQARKSYAFACIRGLVDTDGCLYRHTYSVNGKVYTYLKLCFTNRSPDLIRVVYDIFAKAGMGPRISRDGNDVRIESAEGVKKYFDRIGTSNPKISRIFDEWVFEMKDFALSHPRKK